MDIVEQLIAISFLLTVMFGVVVMQSIAISRLLKSADRYLVAIGFFILGALQVWGSIRLPILILQAQVKGMLPGTLTWDQWTRIVGSFIAIGFLIAGQRKFREYLMNLGI